MRIYAITSQGLLTNQRLDPVYQMSLQERYWIRQGVFNERYGNLELACWNYMRAWQRRMENN